MRNLKRALSLAMASVMLLGLMVVGTGASYSDVASKHNTEAIEVLQAVGIMTGDEKGNFNPDKNVTRNEMAVVMTNLLDLDAKSYAGAKPFTDVPEWAQPYVAVCYANSIVAGTSKTTYSGDASVTAAQASLMIMKALGYFQYQADFGDDWQLATIKQATKIDLYDGISASATSALTRNEVAQLVLNALEANMVETDGTPASVTTPDGTVVNMGSVSYNDVVKNNSAKYNAINSATNDVGKSIVQLGENLYDGKLKKETPNDAFGRPASQWSYKAKDIGTYADVADATWTAKVTEKMLYAAAGSAAVENYAWTVYVDNQDDVITVDGTGSPTYGVDHGTGSTSSPYVGIDISKTNTDRFGTTGNGVLTELFVDSTDETVTVVLINTYVAEVTKVKENDDDYTLTLDYKGSSMASAAKTFDTENGDDFSKNDIVLVTVDMENNDVQSVALAEKVNGTVSGYKSGEYLKMDGTTYNYNYARYLDLDASPIANANPSADSDCTLYLDAYGNVIAFEGSESSHDYLYVSAAETSFGSVSAKVLFADGTVKVIDIDEIDGEDAEHIDGDAKPTSGTWDFGTDPGVVAPDMVYSYKTSGNKYDLTALDAGTDDGEYAVLTNATIKKGTATFSGNVSNSATVFVDKKDGKLYTGYKNVPSYNSVNGYVVYNDDGIADIVFIASRTGGTSDGEGYIFIKSTTAYVYEKSGSDETWTWTAYVDGAETTVVATEDLTSTINKVGLYEITELDGDGNIADVSRVVDLSSSAIKVGTAVDKYATIAAGGTLKTNDTNASNLAGITTGNTDFDGTYIYDDDTIFVVVELKSNNTSIDTVSAGSVSDINVKGSTAEAEDTAVYVIQVDDESDATPLAQLVVIVVPYT